MKEMVSNNTRGVLLFVSTLNYGFTLFEQQ